MCPRLNFMSLFGAVVVSVFDHFIGPIEIHMLRD